MSTTKTKHGYEVYPPNQFHKFRSLYCRDDADALEDIKELLSDGQPLEVHNAYDTFYGCGWGRWLIDNTKGLAEAKVTDSWNPGYYCNQPFPCTIVLTPLAK